MGFSSKDLLIKINVYNLVCPKKYSLLKPFYMKLNKYLVFTLAFGSVVTLNSCLSESAATEEIRGCKDSKAVNFNPDANVDDNSCVVIAQKQNSLLIKFTATWCGPCGSWGAPTFKNLYSNLKGDVLAMSAQVNDALTTSKNAPIVNALDGKYQYSGTPSFALNNTCYNQTTGSFPSLVDAAALTEPKMGAGVKYTVGAGANAGKLNVNLYVKTFQNQTGEFYAATYVLGKKVIATQLVDGDYVNEFEHHHVILGVVGDNPWGEKLQDGSTYKKDDVLNKQYVYEFDPSWKLSEITLQTVIWKKTGNSYEFINCTTN